MVGLTIAIVNWNTRDPLRACLRSLAGALDDRYARVVVVDNASTDGSVAMVRDEFPDVHLLALDRNIGFAGGVNRAAAHARGDYILILNPDVRIGRDAIDALIDFLDRTPSAAAAAPLLTDDAGRPQTYLYRRFPTRSQIALFWTSFGPLARRITPLRRRWLEHHPRGDRPVAVDQLPGAAVLIRRSVFDAIGPFDDGYFVWFEDVDWCYRARLAGHSLRVLPSVRAAHEGGASFRSWTATGRAWQFYRAAVRFLCVHELSELRDFALRALEVDLRMRESIASLTRAIGLRLLPDPASFAAIRREIADVAHGFAAGRRVAFVDAVTPVRCRRAPVGAESAAPPASAERRVDAVIVNWNGRDYLPGCLEALARSTVPVRVVVVDNASTDGSVDYLRAEYPDVEIVALERNLGYAAGANVGIRHCAAPFLMILNPDVALAPDHLARLLERFDADATIGAAQGKLYAASPEAFRAGGLERGEIIDSAGHTIARSRMVYDRGQGRPDGPAYMAEASVFSACGAALLLRREMLAEIEHDGQFFDESFFAYKEDIDLCWRARQRGWDIRYVPDALAHHVRSWPGRRRWARPPLRARRHSWKNHYLLMLKNDTIGNAVRALPAILGWEVLRHAYAIVRDPGVLTAGARAVLDLPRMLRLRRRIAERRRVSPREIRRWFGLDCVAVDAARISAASASPEACEPGVGEAVRS